MPRQPNAPLSHQVKIANENGTPSTHFIRLWQDTILTTIQQLADIQTALAEAGIATEGAANALAAAEAAQLTANDALEAALEETGVTAGTFGDSSNTAVVTVDVRGRITSIDTAPIAGGGGPPADIPTGPFRFWRIATINGAVNGNTFVGFAEMELRDVAGGPDLTSPGDPISASSEFSSSFASEEAIDNNTGTYWASASGSTPEDQFITYDFGPGNDQSLVEIAITSPPVTSTEAPDGFLIQGSTDGVTFTDVLNVPAQAPWPVTEQRVFSLSPTPSQANQNIAQISLSAGVSVSGPNANINFDREDFNDFGTGVVDLATSSITIPAALDGQRVEIVGHMRMVGPNNAAFAVQRNGISQVEGVATPSFSGDFFEATVSTGVFLATAGDVYTVLQAADTTGSRAIERAYLLLKEA